MLLFISTHNLKELRIQYRVAPPRKEGIEDNTIFNVFYPIEIYGIVSGTMEWKYATQCDEYRLNNDSIRIVANPDQYKKEIENVYTYQTASP